ncbi:MAG: tetratricopeptide repeat protein [Acidobacteria bacterium]|nr:tetratricopeptide repeat protein [Acidobacteriota bacterium]
MKRLTVLILFTFLGSGYFFAQTPDLAGSYYHFSLAKMHESRQNYREAISEFEKAIPLDPTSGALRVEFAETLWEAGENRRAIQECQEAIKLDPESSAPHFLLGRIYSTLRTADQAQALDRAIEAFERTIELEPDHVRALYDLGRLHLAKKNYQKTVDILNRFSQLQPWTSQAYLLKARAHIELNEIQEAIESLEHSFAYDETNLENLKLLGNLYEQAGQREKASELYGKSLDSTTDPDIRFRLALLLTDQNQFVEAASILQELVKDFPKNVRINISLARALRGNNKYAEAAEVIKTALQDDPNHYRLNYELAELMAFLGERQEAIERFLHLRDMSDSNQRINAIDLSLARLYQRTRQFDKAVELLQAVVRKNPGDEIARLHLTYALKDAGRLEEALSLSEQLLEGSIAQSYEEQPNKTYLVVAHAQMLSADNQLEKAVALLNNQIAQSSSPEELYLVASQLYVDHENHKEAERMIRDGMMRFPDSEDMRFRLGAVYEGQGKLEETEAVFQGILKNHPQHAGVLNYLGYMLADRGLRLLESLDYINKAVEIEPHNGAYLDSLGWVYFKLNQLELAETNLLLALRLSDSDPTIYDHLGDLYSKLKQYARARTYYRHSVSLAENEEQEKVQKKLTDLELLLGKNL